MEGLVVFAFYVGLKFKNMRWKLKLLLDVLVDIRVQNLSPLLCKMVKLHNWMFSCVMCFVIVCIKLHIDMSDPKYKKPVFFASKLLWRSWGWLYFVEWRASACLIAAEL